MFDDDFLGCMADFARLDYIVDEICAGNWKTVNCQGLTEIDKNYISKEVYRKIHKTIHW